METGFFHPLRGYWQTISEPSNEVLAYYPSETIQVPLKPSGEHYWDGEQWMLNIVEPSVSVEDVELPAIDADAIIQKT